MQLQTSALQAELRLQRTRSWWKKPISWIGAVVVLGGGLSYWMVQNHSTGSSSSTAQVRWITVGRGIVQQSVSLSGTLNPENEVTLTSNGKLTALSVKMGDKVVKGQVIAQLDTTNYESQLKQAQAQLTQAEAKLAQSKEPIITAVGRNQGGSQGGGLGGSQSGTQSPDPYAVEQAQASVDQAQAQVNAIQQQISDCTITSPISGTVLQTADVSQFAVGSSTGSGQANGASSYSGSSSNANASGNTIAIIGDLTPSHFVVQATVDQSEISGIHVGQSAVVSLSAGGGSTVTGKVSSVGYLPQTSGGVTEYPVTIQVGTPTTSNLTLLPGESASVTITEKQANNVLVVPTATLTQRRGESGVYVQSSDATSAANGFSTRSGGNGYGSGTGYSGGSGTGSGNANQLPKGLVFQPITVGLYGGNTVEVKGGLSEGEQVAVVLFNTTTSSSQTTRGQGLSGMGMMGGFGGMGGYGGGQGYGRRSGLGGSGGYGGNGGNGGYSGRGSGGGFGGSGGGNG